VLDGVVDGAVDVSATIVVDLEHPHYDLVIELQTPSLIGIVVALGCPGVLRCVRRRTDCAQRSAHIVC